MDDLAGKIQDLEERLIRYKKALADDALVFDKPHKAIPANEMEADIKCLKTAVELRKKGMTFRNISEKVGYDNTSIVGWLVRGQLPGKLYHLYNMLDIPRGFSPELAYILGAYSAMNLVGSKYHAVLFTAREPFVLRKLKRCVEKIWPGRWCKNKVYEGIYHPDIIRHIRLLTSNNTQVPWEQLGSVAEKKEYLRGIFDSKGSSESDNTGFFITKTSTSFLEDFMVLLAEFNILGTLHKTTNSKCVSFYGSDLARLLKLGVLPKAKKEAFAKLEADPKENIAKLYYDVLIHKDKFSLAELCELFGLAKGTVCNWINNRNRPKSVKRYLAIEKSRRQFDRDAVCFLYRDCGLDSSQARKLAKEFSIDDLRATYSRGNLPKNPSNVISDVVELKCRELREFRCTEDLRKSKASSTLYDKIFAFSNEFSDNQNVCRYYAEELNAEHKIPAKLIYEFLIREKPLKVM